MTVTIDPSTQTISYTDVSNSTSGTVPYTVNANGGLYLNDPTGNLTAGYEVPNYAMIIQAGKTGPGSNTPALITAVESGPISLSTFEGHSYNYMQFANIFRRRFDRIGHHRRAGLGNDFFYWPYGALNQNNNSPFNSNNLDMAQAQLDPSGTFLTIPDPGNSGVFDYVFARRTGYSRWIRPMEQSLV